MDTNTILAMSRTHNSNGLGLTTVGLGTDFNYQLMRDLALQADGNFYFVENAGAVDEVFADELSYFTVPIAFDLTLEMQTGRDYTFGRALGAPLWEVTQNGGKLKLPSVFVAHRISHDDVTPSGGRRGGGSALLIELDNCPDDGTNPDQAQVAVINLSYREPGTNALVTDSVEIIYPNPPWIMYTMGFFDNPIAQKSFLMLNIYLVFEKASMLYHTGEKGSALAILRRVIAAAKDYNDSANGGSGDVDIRYDIEMMERMAEVIIQNGGQEPADPNIPNNPWPCDD